MSDCKVINSYDNTDELLQQFAILNPTPVRPGIERNIQNRLLTGFANWNQGYETWKEWGDILYTPESLYNLYGIHLTLREYQESQRLGLAAIDIQLGDFHNMIVCDDWTAILYDVSETDRRTGKTDSSVVMEFVNFKDYGGELGTRVVEGWASTRGERSAGMDHFTTDEEKAAQQRHFARIESYQIPEASDLAAKFPVMNPTAPNSAYAEKIRDLVLREFDSWNAGWEAWSAYVDQAYDQSFCFRHGADAPISLAEYKESMQEKAGTMTKLYFENMLISGDWVAIRYWTVVTDSEGKPRAQDFMQFFRCAETSDGAKALSCWSL